MALHPQTGQPTIFVYDGYPGGAGIAELAFEAAARHARATLDLITACSCDDGCPSCVQSPKCGNWNEYLDKQAAIALLGVMARERQGSTPECTRRVGRTAELSRRRRDPCCRSADRLRARSLRSPSSRAGGAARGRAPGAVP